MMYEVIKQDWTTLEGEPEILFSGSYEQCMKVLAEIKRDLHIPEGVDYHKCSMVKGQYEYLYRRVN